MNRPLEDAATWIASQQETAIRQLIQWCDQNSWSHDCGNLNQMATRLAHDFAKAGIDFAVQPLPELKLLGKAEQWEREPTGPALIWHHHVQSPHRILLLIHYDTVYEAGTEPATCTIKGDRLIGPGVADAKGGIMVILLAVQAMLKFGLLDSESPEGLGLSIVLNPDEEIGSTASRDLLKQQCQTHQTAFVFEPSLPDGSLVAGRKGSGNFSVVVRGKSAHAGRDPDQGRNAIVRLAKVIQYLDKLHDPAGGITINVGNIDGGGPLNRVPDHAVAQFNVRVLDRKAQTQIETEITQISDAFSGEGYEVTTLGEFHCPPKQVDEGIRRLQVIVEKATMEQATMEQATIEKAGEANQQTVRWQDTGGACDGSKLAAWGLPNIDTMGVCGGNLHSPEEFMLIDSLTDAAIKTMRSILFLSSKESQ